MATKRLYRSRKADILGVCHGIAEWKDLPVSSVQLAVIIIAICTAVVPCLIIYLFTAIILPVNPEQGSKESSHAKSFYAEKEDYETVDPSDREYERMRKKAREAEEAADRTRAREEDWEERYRNSR